MSAIATIFPSEYHPGLRHHETVELLERSGLIKTLFGVKRLTSRFNMKAAITDTAIPIITNSRNEMSSAGNVCRAHNMIEIANITVPARTRNILTFFQIL